MEKPYIKLKTQRSQAWHSVQYQLMIVLRMFSSLLIFIISAIKFSFGVQIFVLAKVQKIIETLYKHITKIHIRLLCISKAIKVFTSPTNTKLNEQNTIQKAVHLSDLSEKIPEKIPEKISEKISEKKPTVENRVEDDTNYIELKEELVSSDKDQELVFPLLTTPPLAHSMQISVPESMSSEKNNSKGRHWKQFKFRRVDENVAETKPPIWQYTFPSMKKQKTEPSEETEVQSVKHRFKRIMSMQGDT